MAILKTPAQYFADLPRDYWHVKEPLGQNFIRGILRGYYIDMREKARENQYHGPQKDSFPLRDQNREGLQLLPVTVTQLALGYYEFWLENQQKEHLGRFLQCADWLVENHTSCPGKMGGWLYHFDHGRLGIKAPFISAMGQGQGVSVLVRAYQLTKKDIYLSTAQKALAPFDIEVSQGGVKAETKDGIYFEEYPCLPYSHILNGHIFSLWGLYDYAISQDDARVMELFEQGTATLEKLLPRYDLGFWSRYGLYPHPMPNAASPFYHELHIAQLRAMSQITENPIFDQYADRWEAQFENWVYFLRAFYGKVKFKVWVKLRKKNISKTPFLSQEAE